MSLPSGFDCIRCNKAEVGKSFPIYIELSRILFLFFKSVFFWKSFLIYRKNKSKIYFGLKVILNFFYLLFFLYIMLFMSYPGLNQPILEP